jgi:hypothetical protein
MKNPIILGLLAVALVGGALWFTTTQRPSSLTQNGGTYCSPDGTLSDTMPIQSHRSYCIKSNASEMTYAPNSSARFAFSIVDDQGNTLKDFAITHTKPMHVIVVRKDLENFQHVHPEFDSNTGVFTISDLTLPTDGQYRVFADFAPQGGQMDPHGMPLVVTISQDIAVGNVANSRPQPLGNNERVKSFAGYQVTLSTSPQNLVAGEESTFTYTLTQGGAPVTDLEEYLGALGHSVILREDTLDFIHAHPIETSTNQNGKVAFLVTLPAEGKYKAFTQFQKDGGVFTADYVVSAADGPSAPGLPGEMDHSMDTPTSNDNAQPGSMIHGIE